jgi:hypothetical protein
VTRVQHAVNGSARLHVDGTGADGRPTGWDVDLVLVVVGVRPDTDLLVRAGATTGARGAVVAWSRSRPRRAGHVGRLHVTIAGSSGYRPLRRRIRNAV